MNNTDKFDLLIQQFNLSTLSKAEWTHEAHLLVALWHIKHYGLADAICQLRSKIILLNHFHGTANNKQSGYNETLTVFWSQVIDKYLKENSGSFEELVNRFLVSASASKTFPFEFYKKEELLSPDYRAVYHKATIKPID